MSNILSKQGSAAQNSETIQDSNLELKSLKDLLVCILDEIRITNKQLELITQQEVTK